MAFSTIEILADFVEVNHLWQAKHYDADALLSRRRDRFLKYLSRPKDKAKENARQKRRRLDPLKREAHRACTERWRARKKAAAP